jgi:1-acyl-sn-glycerol-3-phosphate acyltransferase
MTLAQRLHVGRKLFCFGIFGLGGLIVTSLVFPFILLLPANHKGKAYRGTISFFFALFVAILKLTGTIRLETAGLEKLENRENCIVCANHPTLIDVVFLIALLPNAGCIVKAALWKNPFIARAVARTYIPNSLDSEETLEQWRTLLDGGGDLLLFPESSRTVDPKNIRFHRSAAHIALNGGYDLLPVTIDVTLPSGLGKKDELISSPEKGVIEYRLTVRDRIDVKEYVDLPRPLGARKLTNRLFESIFV